MHGRAGSRSGAQARIERRPPRNAAMSRASPGSVSAMRASSRIVSSALSSASARLGPETRRQISRRSTLKVP